MPTYERFECAKLVRDLVVIHCIQQGCEVDYRMLTDDEKRQALLTKLTEETEEVRTAKTPEECLAELGDLQEVLLALEQFGRDEPMGNTAASLVMNARVFLKTTRESHGFTEAQLEEARFKKAEKKGTFAQGYFLNYLDIPPDHKDIPNFHAAPDKYKYLGTFAH